MLASLISGLLLKPGLLLKFFGFGSHAEIQEKIFEKGVAGKLLTLIFPCFLLHSSSLLFFSLSFFYF